MNQGELLAMVLRTLSDLSIPHMVVGSFASAAYGESRLTQDIDIVVAPTRDQIDRLCTAFPEQDFYVSRQAAHAALHDGGQFNVIHPDSGNKIDFMIARADAWGSEQLARRRLLRLLPDQEGYAASPEDVILGKMLYYAEGGSEKHLRDIAGMLKVSASDIDRSYIERWAEQLGVADVWQAILRRLAT